MDETDQGSRSGAWRGRLSWPVLLLAGWLLYEFTAQPGLAAFVACLKFGWADVRTAAWLRRVDPDRRRGQTCFWCYLTFGLWKVAVMALLTLITVAFITDLAARAWPAPGNAAPQPVFGGTLFALVFGMALSLLTTYVAFWSALRHGVKVWLGTAPHRARRGRFWPPAHGRVNAAPLVAFTALFQTIWSVALAEAALLVAWQPPEAWVLFAFVGLLVVIGGLFVAYFALGRRLFARSPAECWGHHEGEAAYEAAPAGPP